MKELHEAHRVYLRGELGKHADQAAVDAFVDALTPDGAKWLAEACSEKRRNRVASDFRERLRCEFVSVPVMQVTVTHAESDLHDIFDHHVGRLDAIARDPQVTGHKDYQRNDPVRYPVLLAIVRWDGEYHVVDGVHRAVRLVRDGATSVELCVLR